MTVEKVFLGIGLIIIPATIVEVIYPLRNNGSAVIALVPPTNPSTTIPSPAAPPPTPVPTPQPTPINDPECKHIRDQSVVKIQAGPEIGSGSVVADKIVLTNHHVVEKSGGSVELEFLDGRKFPGEVIADVPMEQGDMALIKVDTQEQIPIVKMEDATPPEGTKVVAIGTPYGEAGVITSGEITAGDSQSSGEMDISHTAQLEPGNSGGPLLKSGVCTFVGLNKGVIKNGSGQINLATKVEVVKPFISQHAKK
jgi:S1-C subfamily serine protease